MAESGEPKATCTFLFKKSAKRCNARKRKASDSDTELAAKIAKHQAMLDQPPSEED